MRISVKNNQKKFSIFPEQIAVLCETVLKGEGMADNCELSVTISGEKAMAKLNRDYLGHKGVTDVISFPQLDAFHKGIGLSETDVALGDVIVCPNVALSQHNFFGTSFNQEFGLYLIHGMLHLLGYDDVDENDKIDMEKKQDFWFNKSLKKDKLVLISEK